MTNANEITVKILGDASGFKQSVKDAQKITSELGTLADKYKSSGLGHQKNLDKITKAHNKSQWEAGKKALELEKNLKKAMEMNIAQIFKKQKAQKAGVADIKQEVKALESLRKEYKKVNDFRRGTGFQSRGERLRDSWRSARGMGRSAASGAGSMLMGAGGAMLGAVSAIAGAIISHMTSQITSGYQSYMNFGRARASLTGMGAMKGDSFGIAQRLGYSKTDTVHHMRSVGRQTGNINAVKFAQAAARSFGGDVNEVAGFMGAVTRGGHGFGGKMGRSGERTLQRVMSHAFSSGLDHSRAGEHLAAVSQGIKSAQAVTGGKVDPDTISAMLSYFGRSGMAGLQGEAGFAQLSKIDSAIKSAGFGGGNPIATALAYQSQGFGTPDGMTSFYESTRNLQRGVFGEGGAANLMKYFNRFAQAGGGANTELTNLELSKATGLSLDVVESIWKVIQTQGGNTEAATKSIADITKQQMPIEKQILEATKGGHLEVAQRVAHLENRLIDIGQAAHKDIEAIQDVMLEVTDSLMPTALRALKVIADVIVQLWEWAQDFGRAFRRKFGLEESSDDITRQRADIMSRIKAGTMDRKEAAKQLRDMGQGEEESNMFIDTALSLGSLTRDLPAWKIARAAGWIDENTIPTLEARNAQRAEARRARTAAMMEAQVLEGSNWQGDAIEFEAERRRLSVPGQGESASARSARLRARDEARAARDRAQAIALGQMTEAQAERNTFRPNPSVTIENGASFRALSGVAAPTTTPSSGRGTSGN